MKPYSLSQLRNLLQYSFEEMLKLGRHDPHSYKIGVLVGYIIAKIESQEYSIKQLEQIHNKISDIVGEFVFKYEDKYSSDLTEKEMDELLEALEEELEESVDNIENLVGPMDEETDIDLDELLEEIKNDYDKQVKEINYEKVYHELCDFITTHYDQQIMAIDALEDKTWIDMSEKAEEIGRLRREINAGADGKLKELLGNNDEEYHRFHAWLRKWNGDEGDDPLGEQWWKKV